MKPLDVVVFANLHFHIWKSVQNKSFHNSLGFNYDLGRDGKLQPECPTEGEVKINTDAVVFEKSSHYSVSMIAHDHTRSLDNRSNIQVHVREHKSGVGGSYKYPRSIELDERK